MQENRIGQEASDYQEREAARKATLPARAEKRRKQGEAAQAENELRDKAADRDARYRPSTIPRLED